MRTTRLRWGLTRSKWCDRVVFGVTRSMMMTALIICRIGLSWRIVAVWVWINHLSKLRICRLTISLWWRRSILKLNCWFKGSKCRWGEIFYGGLYQKIYIGLSVRKMSLKPQPFCMSSRISRKIFGDSQAPKWGRNLMSLHLNVSNLPSKMSQTSMRLWAQAM